MKTSAPSELAPDVGGHNESAHQSRSTVNTVGVFLAGPRPALLP
jgi:hypothetical protein